mmetsp:Transcript_29201/g.66138  ORF Transcript_29201/g.66138 Transcript_29201/m.66138 type:complete len:231 (+) Transcript_29201:212-904(+)
MKPIVRGMHLFTSSLFNTYITTACAIAYCPSAATVSWTQMLPRTQTMTQRHCQSSNSRLLLTPEIKMPASLGAARGGDLIFARDMTVAIPSRRARRAAALMTSCTNGARTSVGRSLIVLVAFRIAKKDSSNDSCRQQSATLYRRQAMPNVPLSANAYVFAWCASVKGRKGLCTCWNAAAQNHRLEPSRSRNMMTSITQTTASMKTARKHSKPKLSAVAPSATNIRRRLFW